MCTGSDLVGIRFFLLSKETSLSEKILVENQIFSLTYMHAGKLKASLSAITVVDCG